MAKFSGEIGFATQVQTEPEFWEDKVVEKQYYGDVFREARRLVPAMILGVSTSVTRSAL